MPAPLILGKGRYPSLEEIVAKLQERSVKVVTLDAVELAKEAGSILSANIVMLGATFGTELMPIRTKTIKKVMKLHFSTKMAPPNIRAFTLGYDACQQALKVNANLVGKK